jgi:hypothetical protein
LVFHQGAELFAQAGQNILTKIRRFISFSGGIRAKSSRAVLVGQPGDMLEIYRSKFRFF